MNLTLKVQDCWGITNNITYSVFPVQLLVYPHSSLMLHTFKMAAQELQSVLGQWNQRPVDCGNKIMDIPFASLTPWLLSTLRKIIKLSVFIWLALLCAFSGNRKPHCPHWAPTPTLTSQILKLMIIQATFLGKQKPPELGAWIKLLQFFHLMSEKINLCPQDLESASCPG